MRLAQDHAYAFAIEDNAKSVLIVMDELSRWEPPDDVRGIDLAVIPMGIAEFDPFTGKRRIPKDHILLRLKVTFQQTLAIIRKLRASRVVIHHIEEFNGLLYDDLLELEEQLGSEGYNIVFAYDTMLVQVA